MTTFILLAVLSALVPAQVSAAPAATPAPAATAAPAPAETAAPADNFNYNPEGRRDPFVSLLRGGSDQRGARPGASGVDGIAGLSVDEISVRGVVAGRNGYVAMVMGPDNKTYLVRPNDKLLDGTVKAVTAQGLVILQEVNDPLSLVKQKEVRKMLRGLEEGK
jgi:type IV pilus assembly protein PilP